MSTDVRRNELASRLAVVEDRIRAACADAGRDRDEVTLVAVTKLHPVEDLRLLAQLGVRDVGESRDQEASAKVAALGPQAAQLCWHFLGRLQTNKARHVAAYSDVVHSVDRVALVSPLGRGAREAGRQVGCLVQVSLDDDPSRGGVTPAELSRLATAIQVEQGLRLAGLMAVAPLNVPPEQAFVTLRSLSREIRSIEPTASVISAGMSGDLEAAVHAGATHLRVGTAILGSRQSLQ